MKKIVLLLIAVLITSCKSEVKAPKANMTTSKMRVLTVKYELSDMSLEAHAQLGIAVVDNFAPGKIKGLISKTFIGSLEKGIFGGVYYFKDKTSVDGYLESELWKGIVSHPNLVNFKTERYSVAAISEVSNGFADKRKALNSVEKNTANQLLIVNYELSEMSLEEHAQLSLDVVGNFAPGKIRGLIGKTFIRNLEKKVFGGVYYFIDKASTEAYLASDLWSRILSHPNLVNFKNERYTIAPISSISSGLPSL